MPFAADLHFTDFHNGVLGQPPILLLHGAGSDHLGWPAEIRRLNGWRVLAVDMAGHGRSSGSACSVEDNARKLREFLNELIIWNVILVGHSMGALVAMQLAADIPDRIAALCLSAPPYPFPLSMKLLEVLECPAGRTKLPDLLCELLLAPHSPKPIRDQTLKSLNAIRLSLLRADWQMLLQDKELIDLSHLECPVLLLRGTKDRLVSREAMEVLAESIPGCKYKEIPKAGHLAMLEQPGFYRSALQTFLKDAVPPIITL